jgi:hydroxymethylbilane synthase
MSRSTSRLRILRMGTRASALARAQTAHVINALHGRVGVDIVPIVTLGDRSPEALTRLGGTGVFVSALREALLDGRIDVAVHSYKDLPTAEWPGLTLAAVPEREDPRDALVARGSLSLGALPPSATVGTGSPRRMAQLRGAGYDFNIIPLRGNVETRLRRVFDGELDAVVLAYAGLRRLGQDGAVSEVLSITAMPPAPAQGALAIECREGDEAVLEAFAGMDSQRTRECVAAERGLLRGLEAGCSAPVGAHAQWVLPGDGIAEIYLFGQVTALDGSGYVRAALGGIPDEAEDIGRRLADQLLADGAGKLMGRAE